MGIFRRSKTNEAPAAIDLNTPGAVPAAGLPSPRTDRPDPALGLAVKKLREGGNPRHVSDDDAVYPTEDVEPVLKDQTALF
jgi:hypothetical protein